MLISLALALAAPAAAPAGATTLVTQPMTCPIGGASFDYRVPVSGPVAGLRPDGRPYGTGTYPPPLPECPGNGLVLYKDYTPQEAKTLEPLVASDDYQALRKTDTQYYRAYWLMKQMGVGPERSLLALLEAAWEADGKTDLRARYLTELAEESAKVPARPTDLNWLGLEGRAIDALRELGRFDEASARLAKVPVKALDVRVPEGAGASEEAVRQARLKRGWLAYFEGLKAAIARKDASAEPFDMIPKGVAYGYCLDRTASLDDGQRAFCDGEKAGVEELRVARAKAEDELKALRQSREASGR
jgi:hypothetical protein